MLEYLNVAQQKLTQYWLAQRNFPLEIISAVLNKDTGELMEYRKLRKNPKYRNLYRKYYAKEKGQLSQGMPGLVEEINTMFFIDNKYVPVDRWRDVTYGRVAVEYIPENINPYCTRLTV